MRHVELLEKVFANFYSYACQAGKPLSDDQLNCLMEIRDYLAAASPYYHDDDEQTFSGSPTLGDDELCQ